jgi:hypothetical protein
VSFDSCSIGLPLKECGMIQFILVAFLVGLGLWQVPIGAPSSLPVGASIACVYSTSKTTQQSIVFLIEIPKISTANLMS